MLCVVVVAGCAKQEEPSATKDQSSTPQNPTSNEPAVATEPADEAPISMPEVEVTAPEAVQGQIVQAPPTLPTPPTKLGDPAFPLVGLTTVKGEPVEIKPGKVYVVEFWATWCPPCKESIPHLTALSNKYADAGVVFIGITNEDAGTVKPFVSAIGDKMDYNVAIDAIGGVSQGYMMAFHQDGIPTAFVVDQKGRVVWYGHPMLDLDKIISQVVAGTYEIPS